MTEIVCVRACMRASVCACVRACMCQYIDVFLTLLYYHDQDAKSSYTVMIDSHIYCVTMYTVTVSYVGLQKLLDENTPIAYQKKLSM